MKMISRAHSCDCVLCYHRQKNRAISCRCFCQTVKYLPIFIFLLGYIAVCIYLLYKYLLLCCACSMSVKSVIWLMLEKIVSPSWAIVCFWTLETIFWAVTCTVENIPISGLIELIQSDYTKENCTYLIWGLEDKIYTGTYNKLLNLFLQYSRYEY